MLLYAIPLFLLVCCYAGAILWLRTGLNKLGPGQSDDQPQVSVVIAAKDEELTILGCLSAILRQRYPQERLEILVIDDRSADRTAEIVRDLAAKSPQVRLLQVMDTLPNLAPKKRAIDLAVREARGEIIVTTDADCLPGPEWIAELVKYFEKGVGLVAGYNPYRQPELTPSLFSRMLSLDYFAMATVAAASAGMDRPISCSGGNLAYRKEVYNQIGGFGSRAAWVSGDDDFLLQRVRQETSWKVHYSVATVSFVPTAPPMTPKEFWNQRIRYASKCAHYQRPVTTILIAIYFMNLMLAVGFLLLPFAQQVIPYWLGAIGIKSLAEWSFLTRGEKVLRERYGLRVFLLTAIVHPVYIAVIGLMGQFFNFEWKRDAYAARLDVGPRSLASRLVK